MTGDSAAGLRTTVVEDAPGVSPTAQDDAPAGQEGGLPLSFRTVLRRSTMLSMATLLNAGVQFPLGIVVARVIGPEGLGVVGFVALWQLYASLAKPGIYSAAQREVNALLGQGRSRDAAVLQNIGVTGEGLYVLVAAGVIVGAACLQSHPWLRNGLLIGAAGFILSQAADFVTGLHLVRERFNAMAKATMLTTVCSVLFVLSTIAWLKVYSPLLKIAVVAVAAFVGYRLWAPPLALRLRWDAREFWRLLAIGLPLSLQTFLCWSFRSVDQTAVAMARPLAELGYFTFAKQCVSLGVLVVVNLVIVVQPRLWAELGRVSDPTVLGPQIRRLLCWLFLVTGAMVSFSQAAFGAFVHWLLPNYTMTIGVFELLAFLLVAGTIQNIPVYLLNSATINRHVLVTVVWGAGLALQAGLAAWAVRAGWGLRGIALCSLVSQALLSVVLLALIHRYVVTGWRSAVSLYGWLAGLSLVTGALYAVDHLGPFSYAGTSPVLTVFIIRTALAAVVWGMLAWVIWRGGWSRVLPATRLSCR